MPTPTIAIDAIAGDNVINAAEAAGVIIISGTSSGADGQTTTIRVLDSLSNVLITFNPTVQAGGAWSVVVPAGAAVGVPDGAYTVTADVSDAGGNPATEATRPFLIDETPPAAGVLTITDALIDGNEVSAVPFTVTGLEAGGSGIASFTDGVLTQTVNIVPGTTSYTVNLTGFSRNVTSSSLVVSDAAGNTTSSTGNTTIVATDPNLVLLISDFNAIPLSQWQGNPAYTSVTVKDLPTNFAALTAANIATMAADGVTAIGSSSGTLILTVAQYTELGSLAVTGTAKIVDTAAKIDGMSNSQFAGMAGKNIKLLQSTTTPLLLSLNQFNSLNGVLLPSDKSTTLQASEGSIEGLTSGQLGALAAGNIGHISVAGNVLNLGIDQFSALGSAVLNSGTVVTVNGDVGGTSNDTFTFSRQPFSAADKINGGAGTDTLSLQGNYGALNFNADTISNIEKLKLNGGVSGGTTYNITENDGNLLAGQTLSVTASGFTALDSLVFDGSAETNGTFSFTGPAAGTATFTGGNGADTFALNGGADSVRYTSASQSNGTAYDTVSNFNAATDAFVWNHSLTFDNTVLTGQLKSTTFEANLTTAFAGVSADHAAVFTATGGNMTGQTFLLINDSSVGYSTGDLIVRLTNQTGSLTNSNFKVG